MPGALRVKAPFARGTRVYTPGEIVSGDDPVVKGNESYFEDVDALVSRSVEQATAAPGEKRAVKRVAKKAAPKV